MIQRRPTKFKFLKSGLKFFVTVEIALFLGSYALWRRINTSQDFRLYMHENYPSILNGYYSIGELLEPGDEMRAMDLMAWQQKKESSK
ncbi:uncharacterized protein LOC105700548 [Orussus abietinus]|uniref:uncharacterized protein LOC105700548 n=1 Tax=Orussus abietinus TaxID=222816 RepID=UPI000625D56D|nr:uncharacterized protein LOC105700548 [Orussus abietinus]